MGGWLRVQSYRILASVKWVNMELTSVAETVDLPYAEMYCRMRTKKRKDNTRTVKRQVELL
jgi:hypothetical protein